tara:strand:- start:754 stop:1323 length:570 start_codon:yes stop_codon:yes gene_type:complete
MNTYPIDITKSKKAEKLVFKKWFLTKLFDRIFELPYILFFPFLSGMYLFSKIDNQEPYGMAIFYFIIAITVCGMLFYSVYNLNSLTRINGITRGQNSQLIKDIAEKNKWKIELNNQQMTIISFSWQETGTDWGKQMTILYDKKDILVNCTSYGLFSTPSPFHWFANRKKVNKLKLEFNNSIKNALQHRV